MLKIAKVCRTCPCRSPNPKSVPECEVQFDEKVKDILGGLPVSDPEHVPTGCPRYMEHVVLGQKPSL